nr:hypothetical protein 112 [Pelagibacteraceae bacterium]
MGVGRFAFDAIKNTGKFLLNNAGANKGEIAMRLVPDVGFGIMAGVQTPGDIGDKLIAGTASAVGGSVGGLATAGALKGLRMPGAVQNLGDLAGSFAGDYAGMMVGDSLQRGKDRLMGGQGLTAWERMGAEQQAQYAQQLEQQILSQYGIIPGTREQYAYDPTTGMGVS